MFVFALMLSGVLSISFDAIRPIRHLCFTLFNTSSSYSFIMKANLIIPSKHYFFSQTINLFLRYYRNIYRTIFNILSKFTFNKSQFINNRTVFIKYRTVVIKYRTVVIKYRTVVIKYRTVAINIQR